MSRRRHSHGHADQLAAPRRSGRPIVAIVGRPNVGKSALFNRLTGARLAIVQDRPGVTRDRLYADATAFGREYVLVDTGGFDPGSDDPLKQSIADQVKLALSEADAVICLLDATQTHLPADVEAIGLLRQTQLPVLYTANKVDNDLVSLQAKELYKLGLKRLLEVSALHGHGIGDLEQALAEVLPASEHEVAAEAEADPAPDDAARVWLPRVAIVGRPNAGKSSLINRLLGESRQIVDARPGTTVDSVDTLYDRDGDPLVLIDTAGIRRKRAVEQGLEAQAVMQALRALERCHTAILVIDAQNEGASQQDARIAGLALERGRALCVALNKTDVLAGREREQALAKARDEFAFMPWTPLRPISARTGNGVAGLMKTVREVTANHHRRVTTGEVNRFFEEVLARHPPPTSAGRAVRLYYATQARVAPPTFVVSANYPERVHTSYQRYVVNQLRERFGFDGTPIRVHYRSHKSEE